MDNQLVQCRQVERKYLLEITKCLRYPTRQGIPLQGHDDNDNFTQLLFLLETKDNKSPKMNHFDGNLGDKYNRHDVQNDLLKIMGAQVLREKLAVIRDCNFFLVMSDEGSDVSNKEQLSFCVRTVGENLNVDEDFFGFYEIDNIKSKTFFNAIKDILLSCSLSLDDCRGQTYDAASNKMGKHIGILTKISAGQPKAIETHCQGHSSRLAVKSLTKDYKIPKDTMGTVGEISALLKYSSKREKKVFDKITDNIEGKSDEEVTNQQANKLDKLCVTRWTVRAECFRKIKEYQASLQVMRGSLEEKLDFETKSRIGGCKQQLESFSF